MHTVFPHPTLSEMMHEAVLDAYGRALHYLGRHGREPLDGSHDKLRSSEPRRAAPSREGAPAGQADAAQAGLDPGAAPGSPEYARDAAHRARARPRHGVRGGGLPQHRRVLDAAARHHDDHGRHLHARLRLLQRGDRPARTARSARARAASPTRSPSWASTTSSSPRSTATISPTAAPSISRRRSAPSAPQRRRTTIEVLTPDFLRKAGAVETVVAAAARRLQPQPGDGAAALSEDPPRRALLRTRCACCSG